MGLCLLCTRVPRRAFAAGGVDSTISHFACIWTIKNEYVSNAYMLPHNIIDKNDLHIKCVHSSARYQKTKTDCVSNVFLRLVTSIFPLSLERTVHYAQKFDIYNTRSILFTKNVQFNRTPIYTERWSSWLSLLCSPAVTLRRTCCIFWHTNTILVHKTEVV